MSQEQPEITSAGRGAVAELLWSLGDLAREGGTPEQVAAGVHEGVADWRAAMEEAAVRACLVHMHSLASRNVRANVPPWPGPEPYDPVLEAHVYACLIAERDAVAAELAKAGGTPGDDALGP